MTSLVWQGVFYQRIFQYILNDYFVKGDILGLGKVWQIYMCVVLVYFLTLCVNFWNFLTGRYIIDFVNKTSCDKGGAVTVQSDTGQNDTTAIYINSGWEKIIKWQDTNVFFPLNLVEPVFQSNAISILISTLCIICILNRKWLCTFFNNCSFLFRACYTREVSNFLGHLRAN